MMDPNHIQQPQGFLTNGSPVHVIYCHWRFPKHSSTGGQRHIHIYPQVKAPSIQLVQVKRLICIYIAIQGLRL